MQVSTADFICSADCVWGLGHATRETLPEEMPFSSCEGKPKGTPPILVGLVFAHIPLRIHEEPAQKWLDTNPHQICDVRQGRHPHVPSLVEYHITFWALLLFVALPPRFRNH